MGGLLGGLVGGQGSQQHMGLPYAGGALDQQMFPGFGQGGMMGFLSGGNTPQAQGQGIQSPAPFQGYSTGPGLQQGQAMMEGVDQTKRGQGEQFFADNQDRFQMGPGFDQHYDRARERTTNNLNKQLAARGAYGSSAGIDMIGQALADLDAQQANREADFGLQQVMAGQQAANQAQGLSAGRGQQAFANQMAMGGALDNLMAQTYNPMLMMDQQLMDQAMAMELGLGAEALNQDYRGQERIWSDAERGAGLFGNVLGGMLGGI